MKYKIVAGVSYQDLEHNVSKWIREHPGWEPQGGVCVDGDGVWAQAMVYTK